ncbi:unnamed protein product [Prorocentrum cordatum]|uniref:Uncharacterized protein n=1 Tax=Prorocentrum cordatum TaxID=2364126 RepID=A0ABN9Y5X7_9DINO|nr:unnamed protein product [Polarella glacialis]
MPQGMPGMPRPSAAPTGWHCSSGGRWSSSRSKRDEGGRRRISRGRPGTSHGTCRRRAGDALPPVGTGPVAEPGGSRSAPGSPGLRMAALTERVGAGPAWLQSLGPASEEEEEEEEGGEGERIEDRTLALQPPQVLKSREPSNVGRALMAEGATLAVHNAR